MLLGFHALGVYIEHSNSPVGGHRLVSAQRPCAGVPSATWVPFFPTPLQTSASALGEHDPILLHVGTQRTHYKSW